MKRSMSLFTTLALSAMAVAGAQSASEAFLSAARRAYPTAAYAQYTNTLVRKFGVKKEDNADRPVPGGRIRWHYVEGMRNVRDIGGWNGIPTGRVFRGSEPDCKPNPDPKKYHGLMVTKEGLRVMRDVLKIKTDLDLRGTGECPHPETSALGVRLVRVPISAYTNAFVSVKGYAQALRVFVDPESYPIFFHCWGGADRTGTLAYLIEGLCGASEADLDIDYELTSFAGLFGSRPRTGKSFASFPQFVARLKTYPGGTMSAKIAAYMETTLGLTKDEIAAIKRNILGELPAVQPFRAQAGGRTPCVINGDNDHYFKEHCMKNFVTVDARVSSEAGARKYIDVLAAGGRVTHLFACAVGQRADYDSKACDPIWLAIDEAKARGEKPDEWPVNAKRMHDAGFDCFKVWCEYGRKKGISVWISQRMNDVHHVDRPWNIRTNRFWYEHPELHRCPDHDRTKGGSWTMHAFDYSKPAVQEFEFGIFKELVDRYDADGFELDFMRFWEHLTPGKEREQAPILTAFIKRCRDYANAAATRRGHPILLSTRVPSSYEAARAFGYDPEEWARQGLVDMIAVANFWAAADYDFGFAEWNAKIAEANPAVTVLPSVCDNVSCGATHPCAAGLAALRGWADNVQAAGAEGLYFFNAAYYSDVAQRALYGDGFAADAVRAAERRHLPSFHDCTPKGVSNGAQLPIACAKGGVVNVVVGHADGRAAEVVVALEADAPAPSVTLNGAEPCGKAVREGRTASYGRRPKVAWRIPFVAGAAADGANAVAIAPSEGAKGKVLWCEIALKGM